MPMEATAVAGAEMQAMPLVVVRLPGTPVEEAGRAILDTSDFSRHVRNPVVGGT